MKITLKVGPPPLLLKNYLIFLLMTSHRDIHTTTDVKPELIPQIQTKNGIPHDKWNLHVIATHKQEIQHFHSKTTVHWRSTLGAEHIPLEILRFRSAIYHRCGHFFWNTLLKLCNMHYHTFDTLPPQYKYFTWITSIELLYSNYRTWNSLW